MNERPAGTRQPSGAPPSTHRLLRLVKRATPLVLLTCLLCGASAALVTRAQPDTYSSAVTFVVQTNTGANDSETLIRTIMALIPSRITGEDLRRRAGVDSSPSQIASNLVIERPPGSAVITVTYSDHDLKRSRAVAGELVPAFSSRIARLSEPQAGQLAASYSVLPWGDGNVTTESSPPPVKRNAGIGLVLGLMLGLSLAVLQAHWRPLVNTGLERGLADLPIAAVLPSSRRREKVNTADAMSRVLELVERSATNAGREPWVLVTGPASDRRRGRFVSDLATAFGAASGREVDVVDANLDDRRSRKPAAGVAKLMRHPRDPGSHTAVVLNGPQLPGRTPVLGLLPLVDVVVVLAQSGYTAVSDVVLADSMLRGGSDLPVLTVLLDGTQFHVDRPGAAVVPDAGKSRAAAG